MNDKDLKGEMNMDEDSKHKNECWEKFRLWMDCPTHLQLMVVSLLQAKLAEAENLLKNTKEYEYPTLYSWSRESAEALRSGIGHLLDNMEVFDELKTPT
jgi:hypothetical protein